MKLRQRGPSTRIAQEDIGDTWPLTVPHGELYCWQTHGIVFTAPNGTDYAINGTARSTGKFRDIAEIWQDEPDIPGAKRNISPILDIGLQLCREREGPT